MTNPQTAFVPAIEALEKELGGIERQANALLTSINLLREKAGLPPRPSGLGAGAGAGSAAGAGATPMTLHSDSFTGKKLGSAVRQYLEMRKASGLDAPATSREIYDALKEGGFSSGSKEEATALVVLRTMLRKNTTQFAKLPNGKYGLRVWYPNLRPAKGEAQDDDADGEEDTPAPTTTKKAANAA